MHRAGFTCPLGLGFGDVQALELGGQAYLGGRGGGSCHRHGGASRSRGRDTHHRTSKYLH